MMLMCSGGTSSPRLSRSLLPPHSSPVFGLKAIPTVLRSPRAKMRPPEPSRLNCETAARTESRSPQRLHDDLNARYNLPSDPNRLVLFELQPSAKSSKIVLESRSPGGKAL